MPEKALGALNLHSKYPQMLLHPLACATECIRRIGPILWIGKCPEFMNIEWSLLLHSAVDLIHVEAIIKSIENCSKKC